MTDQLMDDLTNEEHEALLLMSEHAIAAPLSPAAKAVLNDAYEVLPWMARTDSATIAAVVLRAAGDTLFHPTSAHTLYAIADELEAIK